MAERPFDLVLVGGGLQSGLIALATLHQRPDASIALVEAAPRLGGNHRWSFHADDVPAGAEAWVAPLVERTFSDYEVRFPRCKRVVESAYATFDGAHLDRVVRGAFARSARSSLFLDTPATSVDACAVELANGRTLSGALVVDSRGPTELSGRGPVAYQKFVGLEVALERDIVPRRPLLMDATVEQIDGFRFVYVIPLGERRALIEDTYFSDTPILDHVTVEARIHAYAEDRGLRIHEVTRREHGVLPLPLRAETIGHTSGAVRGGYGGGFFHPTTGYSFPSAVRLAVAIAARSAGTEGLGPAALRFAAAHRRQYRFAVFLNRLLFGAFDPSDRRNVLERFYGLPEPTIRRFYAMSTTWADRSRILCGRPPRGFSLRLAFAGAPS